MFDFRKITDWRLLKGSHDFPGPDGGTCLNEAAIIAAGFEYKAVSSAKDCPRCFSRPISAYAIALNDIMTDDLRQELLLPFVMRLAGTADTKVVEQERRQFMALETCRRIMSLLCEDVLKRPDLAQRCRNASDLREARSICREIAATAKTQAIDLFAVNAVPVPYNLVVAAAAKIAADPFSYAFAADTAATAAACTEAGAKRKYFTTATQILDEAIKLGNHPADDDIYVVNQRLEAAKYELAV